MSGLTENELRQQIGELLDVRDSLSQKLRAAQHEAEALAATVEALRDALTRISEWPEGAQASIAIQALSLTPQQHLRDVEAKAGRAGFIAGYEYASYGSFPKEFADEYAERVKDGE